MTQEPSPHLFSKQGKDTHLELQSDWVLVTHCNMCLLETINMWPQLECTPFRGLRKKEPPSCTTILQAPASPICNIGRKIFALDPIAQKRLFFFAGPEHSRRETNVTTWGVTGGATNIVTSERRLFFSQTLVSDVVHLCAEL